MSRSQSVAKWGTDKACFTLGEAFWPIALMTLSVKALKSIDMAWMVAEFARGSRRVSALSQRLSRRLLRLIVEESVSGVLQPSLTVWSTYWQSNSVRSK